MKIPTFLKWAGGKRRLISQIDPHLPKKVRRYFEPFLGAGSMFFYMKQKYDLKNCFISDINKDLIETFKAVRDKPKELIVALKTFKGKNDSKNYYLIRDKFNKRLFKGLQRCAAFIYLNKHCFNGLYRVNSNGKFNVPFGRFKNPELYDEEKILFASELLVGVKITCQDYDKIVSEVKKNDFIYLDPCYDPLKKTSFANYTPNRFNNKDNERLAIFVSKIKSFGGKILLSNNITDNIKKLYSSKDYNKVLVYCSRSINSRGSSRNQIPEYLIKNY